MSTENTVNYDYYVILINDDHSFTHTNVKRLMYRSNLIDTVQFLVKPMYNDLDMTKVNVVLEYRKPVSHEYATIVLKPEAELYKNRVQYLLPLDLEFTGEVGDLELTINFSYLSMNEDGTFKEQVRTIGFTAIIIEDTVHWSDYIPTAKLDNIAQIMMQNQAITEQTRANLELMQESMATNMAVSIKHNEEDNTIYLVNEDGVQVGETVDVEALQDGCCENGVPIWIVGDEDDGSDDSTTNDSTTDTETITYSLYLNQETDELCLLANGAVVSAISAADIGESIVDSTDEGLIEIVT